MKTRGGYSIRLQGKPSKELLALNEPTVLHLPLKTRRFSFTATHVKEGDHVAQGAILASDPGSQNLPLIAPRGGIVNLSKVPGHITLERLEAGEPSSDPALPAIYDIPAGIDEKERIVRTLLRKGAWQFFTDAFTGMLPDPLKAPQAIIISTVNLEPFSVRGDVLLEARFEEFVAAIEKLQPVLEYQPVWMIFPVYRSELGRKIREFARGKAWIRIAEIERKYPNDNDRLLAKRLGLKAAEGPVWCVRTEGVMATHCALVKGTSSCGHIIAVGGPSVAKPSHMYAMPGYPIDSIMEQVGLKEESRVILGGALTGTEVDGQIKGLDSESLGITALPVGYKREPLSFVMPGFRKRSYSNTFASLLRPKFDERIPTILYGEVRPCINCGFCVDVCPAGIIPSAIHKANYADDFDSIEKLMPMLCVECGLCSYVCTSKIDLFKEILDVKENLRKEAELLAEGAHE
ncbi:MAG TPA: 4Fe-4S dicluster domain-containing protein [Rectinemataceae bacterium]|nr:4Fe-4S dicluster domain-containing protein [Rectinemataceae bacterium]